MDHGGADLLGPLPSGEYLLVVVDNFSRFFETVIMKSVTSSKVIDALQPILARFGVPYSLRTDNGTQFVSEEFKAYLSEHGIEHRKTPPLWPQANGEVPHNCESTTHSTGRGKTQEGGALEILDGIQVNTPHIHRGHPLFPNV